MRPVPDQPIGGPAAWHGRDLARSPAWRRRLEPGQVATLVAATARAARAGTRATAIRREDFPLPGFADLIASIHEELERGVGVVRLSGVPVEGRAEEDLRRMFWGLGTHLGAALRQNARGELIGEVRDERALAEKTYVETAPGRVATALSRSRSSGPLRFHTDRCDAIALLCVRNGVAGGESKLASSVRIHDEILARRPDLLATLYRDFWRARPEDEDGSGAERAFALPVFALHEGWFTSQYSRTYVEQAQEFPEVPRLTGAQLEAMDLLAEVAEEICLSAPFEPGDVQIVNNHVVYHGRTEFADDAAAGRTRLLLRLWLSTPGNRPLPPGFEVLWGSVAANAVRGGIPDRAAT